MIPFWLLCTLGVEACFWLERRDRRRKVFRAAERRADELGRPLVVVGAPDGGVTGGYACGDLTIDTCESSCPNLRQWDVTRPIPLEDASSVVYCCCVLEYVGARWRDALEELLRVSGGELYLVTVEPFTLTGWLYPGTRLPVPWELQEQYGAR